MLKKPAPLHPGHHIRQAVLVPKKLSVLAAAKLVGVGRPAFSNFLNGHVTTSPEMASRLEVAFGVPAKVLLDMQAAYNAAQVEAEAAPGNAKRYVVPFLGIKAAEIEQWVERNIGARTRLSVLLRTLVNSSGAEPSRVDFPGNDDAENPGWDGYVELAKATPWIPAGRSGWEFGVNKNINEKANGDYAKSVKGVGKAEREQMTFVFVTPRHWSGKNEWLQRAKAKGHWKDVRAYDSSDLEQWIEQSLPAQAWFANETLKPSSGVLSLDKCWSDWAEVASPALPGSLFRPAIEASSRTIQSRLAKEPDGPAVIAADSTEEALAFLSQVFGPESGDGLEKLRDRVLVFDEPGVVKKLLQGCTDFIAVTANRQVERELASATGEMHTFLVYPRNASNVTPDVVLEPLGHEAFNAALESIGIDRDRIAAYSNESGRSLTVLRRRMARAPAIKSPEWAQDPSIAECLVPFLFAGAWNSENNADQAALGLLADTKYETLEKDFQRHVSLNDAPLWSAGSMRGLISKIDLLFAISGAVTTTDLKRFYEIAKLILAEDDPKLDLPEEDRWAAVIRGKSREFSAALREGVSETLVLLAVHGNNLFLSTKGFNCETAAENLVADLLTPLSTRILEANDRDLTAYAEAAPATFLSIIDGDLKSAHPASYALMRPAGTGIFGACPRSGLLWALEGLAWNPQTMPRAALALAQLAEIDINDNWANKPINSLESIFRAWMPQTTADLATRVRIVKLIAEKVPRVAWKICMSQLDASHTVGSYSHKPIWRNDAYGHGEPVKTWNPVWDFRREMLDLALGWARPYSREMICDLIQHLPGYSEEYQSRVWELIKDWGLDAAADSDKAVVREKIRVTIMSRRGSKRTKNASANLPALARKAYDALQPVDLLNKHEWLFRQAWVEESADDLRGDDFNYQKREERIANLRAHALVEVIGERGIEGLIQLAEMGRASHQIGWLLVSRGLIAEDDVSAIVNASLSVESEEVSFTRRDLVASILRTLDEQTRVRVVTVARTSVSEVRYVDLLMLAPFSRSTWCLVEGLDESRQERYWNDVVPEWPNGDNEEANEAIEHLLRAKRPRAAFAIAHFRLEVVRPELLFRLMTDLTREGADQDGRYQLHQYEIEAAFVLVDKNPSLTLDQKAGLEFAFIEALSQPRGERTGYGIPNLERYVEAHPDLFIQAIVWTYRRGDGGEDPPDLRPPTQHARSYAERGYKLLDSIKRTPGHDDLGELREDRLMAWIATVREACSTLGRLEVADLAIGKILSASHAGEDGLWPTDAVRNVMEDIHSVTIMRGAHTGLYNARGATWRGDGGDQERAIAEKYRKWANAIQFSHPFVAAELLMGMAKTYENEANREDTEAGIRRRLR